ncbi:MAG: hypothetical protein U5K29_08820 [Acidimicrobiales bacterium]|nr:hypothetical protein [Acidimicrobiales bacterium]
MTATTQGAVSGSASVPPTTWAVTVSRSASVVAAGATAAVASTTNSATTAAVSVLARGRIDQWSHDRVRGGRAGAVMAVR